MRLRKILTSTALACLAAAGVACSPPGSEAQRPSEAAEATEAGEAAAVRPLDPPAAPGAMAPRLTPAGEGLLLTWIEPVAAPGTPGTVEGESGHRLRFSRLSGGKAGETWSEPVTVAEGTDFFANWADFPGAVEAADGTLWAHWLAKTGPETYAYSIFLARSEDGGATWAPAGVLHDDGLQAEHGFVSWLPGEGGAARAFWLDGREMPGGGPMTLRAGTVTPAGIDSERIDAKVCDCCQTDAAMTSSGPVVVYRDRSDQEIRDIYILRRAADGGWTEPAPVHRDGWKIPGCPVNGPAVSAQGERVAVAWFTAAEPTPRVLAAFSDDGGASFGEPVVVDGERPLGRVDVELVEGGGAVVSWLAVDAKKGDGAAVKLRRVAPGGAAGEPVTLAATSAARSSGFPRMARRGGDLVLVWVEGGEVSNLRGVAIPPQHRNIGSPITP